jgi:hypothetical protein
MDRIYLLSFDGRIFYAEPNSVSFELLYVKESSSTDANDIIVKVKKLSSCDYCLWAIDSTFNVNLFVFQSDVPIEHQEVTYENQVNTKIINSIRIHV